MREARGRRGSRVARWVVGVMTVAAALMEILHRAAASVAISHEAGFAQPVAPLPPPAALAPAHPAEPTPRAHLLRPWQPAHVAADHDGHYDDDAGDDNDALDAGAPPTQRLTPAVAEVPLEEPPLPPAANAAPPPAAPTPADDALSALLLARPPPQPIGGRLPYFLHLHKARA
jgi:hypothetical protein